MSLRQHVVHYWPHYSLGTLFIGLFSRIDLIWEKTEWLRAMVGWVEKKKKKRRKK